MTIYQNISNVKLWKGISYAVVVISAVIVIYDWIYGIYNLLYFICYPISMFAVNIPRIFFSVIVDEEKGLVFLSTNKQFPMPIADIKTVLIKQTKKGKYRSLFIKDHGIRFLDIRLNEKQGMALLEQLKAMNPNFEVLNVNYM